MDTKIFKGWLNNPQVRKRQEVNREIFLKRGTNCPMNNSSLENPRDKNSFFKSFKDVLEGKESLKEYIENRLEKRKGQAVGVEFGGDAINVFKGFSKGFFSKSAGICLEKCTNTNGDLAVFNEFNSSNSTHYVLRGDIFGKKVYEALNDLNITGVDLILERMGGIYSCLSIAYC